MIRASGTTMPFNAMLPKPNLSFRIDLNAWIGFLVHVYALLRGTLGL